MNDSTVMTIGGVSFTIVIAGIIAAVVVTSPDYKLINVDGWQIAVIVLGSLIGLVLLYMFLVFAFPDLFPRLIDITKYELSNHYWKYIIPGCMIGIIITYAILAIVYSQKLRANPTNINNSIMIQEAAFSNAIMALPTKPSVITSLVSKVAPYDTIEENLQALVNWRPMTVRLSGYLHGPDSIDDGVFDLQDSSSGVGANISINLALKAGARAFVLDIGYLDDSPCVPRIVNYDSNTTVKSLNTGSILGTCKCLSSAFTTYSDNQDPILIILNIVKQPVGTFQLANFFQGIAQGLLPLAPDHLGSTDNGMFHSCASEAHLFTSTIRQYQSKFIVLTNYDT